MKKPLFLALLLCLSASPAFAHVNIEEVVSEKGVKAWLARDDKLPLISVSFAFRGGVEQDEPEKQGLSVIAAEMLTQGADKYDYQSFQKLLAENSISLNVSAGRDFVEGEMKTLSRNREKAFRLLGLALTKPRFDAEDFRRIKDRQTAQMRFSLGSAEWQARYALYSRLFKDHPYSMRSLGTEKTLGNISTEDLRDFAASRMARDNLFIAVTGDITPAELRKYLDAAFSSLPEKSVLKPIKKPASGAGVSVIIEREGTQTETLFAIPMPKRDDADWYAAAIANYIIGGGSFSSRLMKKIRSEEGLTYGVGTALAPMESASLLIGNMSSDNDKTGRAWNMVMDAFKDFRENGATKDEIKAAKDYLTGAMPIALSSTSAISEMILHMQTRNLGVDYLNEYGAKIRAVGDEEINDVIRKWFDPEKVSAAFVGMPDGIQAPEKTEQTKE